MDLLNVALLALNTTFDDSWSLDRDIRTTENTLSEVSTIDSDYGSGSGLDNEQKFFDEVTTVSPQKSDDTESKNIFKGETIQCLTTKIYIFL